MAVIHISVSDLPRDLDRLLAEVRAGGEVLIEDGSVPIAIVQPPKRHAHLTLRERIALLQNRPGAVMDETFARDVQAGIDSHREDYLRNPWD